MGQIQYTKGGEGGWVPLPAGTFDIRIQKAEMGNSKGGNPQMKITGEVVDGTHAGKTVNIWYSLLPQSTWKFDKLLDTLEIPRVETGEFNPDGTPIMSFDDDHLIGRCLRYDVTEDTYNNKPKNNFDNEAPSPYDSKPTTAAGQAQAQTAATAAAKAPQQATVATGQPAAAGAAMPRRPRPAGA